MKMSKMKKNRKKLFAILLQAALVSTAMTMPAYAAKTPGIGSDARIGKGKATFSGHNIPKE